jgi:membrane-bound metal-dependent hydrolase YbcI (DUF457 family)
LLPNLPDWPLTYWGHDRYTISHSLFVNLLLSFLALVFLAWRPDVRHRIGGAVVLVGAVAAWLSHLILDSFYNYGGGVSIFWPFSGVSLALPIPWFSVVPPAPPITLAHLQGYAIEFISYFPLILLAYTLRRAGITERLARAVSGAAK